MKQLVYDYSFMMADYVGDHGATQQELDEIQAVLQPIVLKLAEQKPAFTRLPYDDATLAEVSKLATEMQADFENLIVLGIGGSDLGARAVISALKHPHCNFLPNNKGLRVFFLGGNTDPQEIADILHVVDLKKTAINIISKSGDTIEPMSAFVLLRDLLMREVGEKEHAKHIIATTDAEKGTMREITNANGYASLVVPGDVGGRFSVLSTVGLFPAACAGVDTAALLKGAAAMDETIIEGETLSEGSTFTIAAMYAVLHFLALTKRRQPIQVVMPYAEHLRQFGFWYRQLWAESLGKKENLKGEVVHVGPTPVAALGATDQHSQMQLYMEGPFDKVLTFIRIEKFSENFTIPTPHEELEGLRYMAGHDFAKIINTEAQASAIALAQNGRPNGTIILPELTAETLGALFMLYEWATAYIGELLGINTYNQPGVEAGKQNMYALLGREGFEAKRKELKSHISGKKYMI